MSRSEKERQDARVFHLSFIVVILNRWQVKLRRHNEYQMRERVANENKQKLALMRPDKFLHLRLDAMGTDLSDNPFWVKADKKKKERLPCRIMGSTISGRTYEHFACVITDFGKEVEK